MSWSQYDKKVAQSIHDQLNCTGITENAIFPEEKNLHNYRPRTLVDRTLELIDPTPNIFTLFIQFNQKFFWNALLPVQVKWSPRMTSCAGICSFHPRNRECIISLSTPLLKLRPRKDLVETLLHEMIHAYLFLTNDNRDRDGHGPVFQSHMKRINTAAGTNITIYHSFHEEVKLYQQHWWRCNGPCQGRAPFFGTVRRAMNRAPGPNDRWWAEHQATCGGQFIKIREPEKPEKKSKKDSKGQATNSTKVPEKNSILNYVNKSINTAVTQNKIVPKSSSQPQVTSNKNNTPSAQIDLTKLGNSTNNVYGWGTAGPSSTNKPNKSNGSSYVAKPAPTPSNSISNFQTDLKKLGNSTNNVHGWGTGGPGSTSAGKSNVPSSSTQPRLSFSGTLGGTGRGRSILLDKFENTSKPAAKPISNSTFKLPATSSPIRMNVENTKVILVNCPICSKKVEENLINQHLDTCLESPQEPEVEFVDSSKKRKSEDLQSTPKKIFKNDDESDDRIDCPLCNKKLKPANFNQHLDKCAQGGFDEPDDFPVPIHDSSSSSVSLHDSPHHCLICDKKLEPGVSLNDHLEECVSSVFNEDDDNDFNSSKSPEKLKTDKIEVLDKYPCPICMTLVEGSLMNQHLDECITED